MFIYRSLRKNSRTYARYSSGTEEGTIVLRNDKYLSNCLYDRYQSIGTLKDNSLARYPLEGKTMMKSDKMAHDTTLTLDELTLAIRNGIDKEGMPDDQAKQMAQHILNFFGYSERIIDNILEPEDRDAFYMLEDTGILTTEREETTLYDGREWRIHYWLFRKERIYELIDDSGSLEGDVTGQLSVYDELGEEAWQRSRVD